MLSRPPKSRNPSMSAAIPLLPPLFPPCATSSSWKFAAAYSPHAVTRWTATLQGLRCPANVRLEYRECIAIDRAVTVPKTKPATAAVRWIGLSLAAPSATL